MIYLMHVAGTTDGDFTRRAFTYGIVGSGTVIAAHAAKNIVQDFLMTMGASVCQFLIPK